MKMAKLDVHLLPRRAFVLGFGISSNECLCWIQNLDEVKCGFVER